MKKVFTFYLFGEGRRFLGCEKASRGSCFALPCFGSLEEGLAERDERAGRKGLEKRISEDFAEEEKRILSLTEKAQGRGGRHERANKEKAREGLAREWKSENSFEVGKTTVNQLQERLSNLHESVAAAAQEELTDMRKEGRKGAEKRGRED